MKSCLDISRLLRAVGVVAALAAGACGGGADEPVNVSITINTAVPHQTLVGFGAATAYEAHLLAGRADDIYQVMFVDSGLDILRLGNWYQVQGSTMVFADQIAAEIVRKATAARAGVPPKILMSGWSPPAVLKSNGVTRPPYMGGETTPAGTLVQKDGAYAYADYADWWVRSLQAYAAQGVVPDWVSIQNEPDFFIRHWETCVWGAKEGDMIEGIRGAGYGKALDAVHAAIAASTLASPPVLLGPETTGFRDNVVQRYVNGLDPAKIGGIAHHLYGTTEDNPSPDWFNGSMRDVAKTAAALGLPTFMTEYSPNAPTMFDTAWLINNALTIQNAASYIYWELIWTDATPATGLVSVPRGASPTTPYTINDIYYALKHFARWTDPGWVRVDAKSNVSAVRTSAFISPDGASLTLVLLNAGAKDHTIAVDPGAFAFGTLTVYRTSGDTERAAVVAPESDGTIVLPVRGIATITYTP